MKTNSQISVNLQIIRENIEKAAARSGRSGNSVKLIGVTKFQPVEKIQEAISIGLLDFGENYAEKAVEKITHFASEAAHWHMIGHIQSRKAKIVAEHFNYIHTLDSLHLAQKISDSLTELNKTMDCLIEVNIAGEKTKSGYSVEDPEAFQQFHDDVIAIQRLPGIRLVGLMCMPPLSIAEEQSRLYFSRMSTLLKKGGDWINRPEWKELSMGTSGDYQLAIEYGATMVRVGTSLFGERIQRD